VGSAQWCSCLSTALVVRCTCWCSWRHAAAVLAGLFQSLRVSTVVSVTARDRVWIYSSIHRCQKAGQAILPAGQQHCQQSTYLLCCHNTPACSYIQPTTISEKDRLDSSPSAAGTGHKDNVLTSLRTLTNAQTCLIKHKSRKHASVLERVGTDRARPCKVACAS
jgi:hypothetical protein